MAEFNQHIVTDEIKLRVESMAMAGLPKYAIAELIGIDDETLTKYYRKELQFGKAKAVATVGSKVYQQAIEGNEKSQALYLKTQGSSFGWVEKQVIENTNNDETKELKDKVLALEELYKKDY